MSLMDIQLIDGKGNWCGDLRGIEDEFELIRIYLSMCTDVREDK